jgi:death-on-curing protein
MTWRFLRVEEVQAIQTKLIDDYGGSHGLRDAGLLDSAVARARNKALYEEEVTAGMIAASLSYGLIKNHAFIDGDKRIGLAALLVFLDTNGCFLDVSEEEAIEMVLRAAASEISEEEWTAWVGQNIRPGG